MLSRQRRRRSAKIEKIGLGEFPRSRADPAPFRRPSDPGLIRIGMRLPGNPQHLKLGPPWSLRVTSAAEIKLTIGQLSGRLEDCLAQCEKGHISPCRPA